MDTNIIIFIITNVIGGIGLFIKNKLDINNLENRINNDRALMQKDIDNLIKTKDIENERFEKVLDKLENSIEKLNVSQTELVKAISELRMEIKNK